MTDDEEAELKEALMRADLNLKQKPATWETPRNIAILAGTVAAIMAAIFGALGYKIGSQPQQIVVHLDAPLVVSPAAKPTGN